MALAGVSTPVRLLIIMPIHAILNARRAEIEAEIKALKLELEQVRAAEEAIAAISGEKPKAKPSGVRNGSIKDWILKALETERAGLDTEGVISVVSFLGGPEVLRSSMTPQLSRLKSAGLIALDGRKWLLPKNLVLSDPLNFTAKPDGDIQKIRVGEEASPVQPREAHLRII
jgi:hypothetical protein